MVSKIFILVLKIYNLGQLNMILIF
jgi:hypothetical protein